MSDNGGWRPEAPDSFPPQRPEHPPVFPRHRAPDPASEATPVRPMIGSAPPPSHAYADPVGMQSVLTRARDQSRFVAPVIEDERARRPFPVKAMVYIVLAVLAIGIGTGYAYVNFIRETPVDPNVIVQPTATNSVVDLPDTPQDLVREYFTALNAGDVQRALSLGPTAGTGLNTLVSPGAYAATRQISPIDNIEILTEDPLANEIDVRYTIAGEPIETRVRLIRLDTGEWQLARTTASVQLQVVGGQNLPVLLNGVVVDHDQALELVPGHYRVTSGLPYLVYPEDTDFRIETLAQRDVQTFPVTPQLTEDGRDAFMLAARESLNRCVAQRSPTPTGCPFAMDPSRAINPDSVRWELLGDPWQGVSPSLKADDQSIAIMTMNIRTRLTFTYADGSSSGNNDHTFTAQVSANMLGAESDGVAVVWSR